MTAANCPACSSQLPPGSRYCAACGASLPEVAGDLTTPYGVAAAPCPLDPTRFQPGQLLAGRYRVVAALGKGGMGEVYRADDLALGQAVALKFLPTELVQDPDRLARFRQEIRVARQVSHPHVCRVYDIGEADGQPFLTMEYVDGEDLAALLKKVGRLPEDKGVEIARQIGMGLAAAHEQGVIHRDLKPANVLLDGRGQVRLTDFGLAGQAEAIHGTEIRHGTPAYQAPEQLAGEEVSVQSDLYSLGLILYEMFTGKRPFPANSLAEIRRSQQTPPGKPSSHVSGLNAEVERVILRCLERNPADRPRSVYQVLGELPGGDPVRAALAVGQTPSPEAVANAGVEGDLRPSVAVVLLAFFLVGLVTVALSADRVRLFRQVPLHKSPQELTFQAQGVLERLGVQGPVAARDATINADNGFLNAWAAPDAVSSIFSHQTEGRPAAVYFRYRQSPRTLLPDRLAETGDVPRLLGSPKEPFNDLAGLVSIDLDLKGRLKMLVVVPERREADPAAAKEADWDAPFREAGLDRTQFHPVPPQLLPPFYADERMAWEGTYPEAPDVPLRVEAAASRGRVVFFDLVEPWRQPAESVRYVAIWTTVSIGFDVLILLVGGWLAYRNWRRGGGDLGGAARLAVYLFVLSLLSWLLSANHVADYFTERRLAWFAVGTALYDALKVALAYFALEPYVRRRWPWRLVSWQRVLSGRWRDALVGRDVLLGCAAGMGMLLLAHLVDLGPAWWGAPAKPSVYLNDVLAFHNPVLPVVVGLAHSCATTLTWFFALFFLSVVVRRDWLAAAVVLALVTVVHIFGRPAAVPSWWMALVGVPMMGLIVGVTLRYGLLPGVVAVCVYFTLQAAPVTADLSTWYVWYTVVPLVFVVGLAGYGFVVSLGGRSVFGKGLLGEV